LKAIDDENAKLKKLLALKLDKAMLKQIAAKKWRRAPPGERRSLTFVSRLRSASGGRVQRSEPIGPRSGTAASGRTMLRYGHAYANWPPFADIRLSAAACLARARRHHHEPQEAVRPHSALGNLPPAVFAELRVP
jgi:hypothetical protein